MKNQYVLVSISNANLKFVSRLAELATGAQFNMLRSSLSGIASVEEVVGDILTKSQSGKAQPSIADWPVLTSTTMMNSQTQIAQGLFNSLLDIQKDIGANSKSALSEWQSEVQEILRSLDYSAFTNEWKNKFLVPFPEFLSVGKK